MVNMTLNVLVSRLNRRAEIALGARANVKKSLLAERNNNASRGKPNKVIKIRLGRINTQPDLLPVDNQWVKRRNRFTV